MDYLSCIQFACRGWCVRWSWHVYLSCVVFTTYAEPNAPQTPATVCGPDSSGPNKVKQGTSIWLSVIQMAHACLQTDNFAPPLSNTGN